MLLYIDEVARCGSMRKAAAKLNVASTAINRRLIALENQMGVTLFERMPRRLRLTAAGEVVIGHVRETLKSYGLMEARLDAMKGLHRGKVEIATTLGLAAGPMASIIANFMAAHPGLRVHLRGLFADGIPNSVLTGEVALGLAFNLKPDAALKTLLSLDIPLGVVIAPNHPLARQDTVRLYEVAQSPLVFSEPSMSLRTVVDLAFSRLAQPPQPEIETNSIECMRKLVRQGPYAAILNPLDVAEDCAAGQLIFRRINEPNLRPQTLKLVMRKDNVLDPASSRFVETLQAPLEGLLRNLL